MESSLVAQFKTPVTVESDTPRAARGLLVRRQVLPAYSARARTRASTTARRL